MCCNGGWEFSGTGSPGSLRRGLDASSRGASSVNWSYASNGRIVSSSCRISSAKVSDLVDESLKELSESRSSSVCESLVDELTLSDEFDVEVLVDGGVESKLVETESSVEDDDVLEAS